MQQPYYAFGIWFIILMEVSNRVLFNGVLLHTCGFRLMSEAGTGFQNIYTWSDFQIVFVLEFVKNKIICGYTEHITL